MPKELSVPPAPLALLESGAPSEHGYLRADGIALIEADTDLEAVSFWLKEKGGASEQTLRSYHLCAERFLLWCSHQKRKRLSDIKANDLAEFREFLSDPSPHAFWCGPRVNRSSAEWRPFQAGLSVSSQQLTMTILSSMLSFLCDAGYLRGNPARLLRRQATTSPNTTGTIERFLNEEVLKEILVTLDELPIHTLAKRKEVEQSRWTFMALVTLGLRREEITSHGHSAFVARRRPSGEQWWCRITGKGQKTRVIPVPPATLHALRSYRLSLGIKELPNPGDETPMVVGIRKASGVSASQIYRIIKKLCVTTADRIENDRPHEARQLRDASPHWLRHSYITALGNMGVSLKHRKLSAGHTSIETTARYDHTVEDAWYQEMQKTPFDTAI